MTTNIKIIIKELDIAVISGAGTICLSPLSFAINNFIDPPPNAYQKLFLSFDTEDLSSSLYNLEHGIISSKKLKVKVDTEDFYFSFSSGNDKNNRFAPGLWFSINSKKNGRKKIKEISFLLNAKEREEFLAIFPVIIKQSRKVYDSLDYYNTLESF